MQKSNSYCFSLSMDGTQILVDLIGKRGSVEMWKDLL